MPAPPPGNVSPTTPVLFIISSTDLRAMGEGRGCNRGRYVGLTFSSQATGGGIRVRVRAYTHTHVPANLSRHSVVYSLRHPFTPASVDIFMPACVHPRKVNSPLAERRSHRGVCMCVRTLIKTPVHSVSHQTFPRVPNVRRHAMPREQRSIRLSYAN